MGKKVLVVDDDQTLIMLLDSRLTSSGFDVVFASDGREALRVVKSHKPDVILTDVMMPKMTGYEFCNALKKEGAEYQKIPILIMSSRKSMIDFFDHWEAAVFLQKPIDPKELVEKINAVLKTSDDTGEETS